MSWTKHERMTSDSSDYFAYAWIDGDEIVAVAQHGAMVRSTNGGKTFADLEKRGPSHVTHAWRSGDRWLALGERAGMFARQANGAWLGVSPKSKDARVLYGDAAGNLVLTLAKPPGTVMRSTDGGAKWKKAVVAGIGSVVTGDGEGNVYLERKGKIVRSRDRGATFDDGAPYTAPKDAYLVAACALPSGHVWFVGYQGVALHSSDFGATWKTEATGTTDRFGSIYAASDAHVYACTGEALYERAGGKWKRTELVVEGALHHVAGDGARVVVAGSVFGAGPTLWVGG